MLFKSQNDPATLLIMWHDLVFLRASDSSRFIESFVVVVVVYFSFNAQKVEIEIEKKIHMHLNIAD